MEDRCNANPKHENRNPKQIPNPNESNPKPPPPCPPPKLGEGGGGAFWTLAFRVLDLLRISDFGFRILRGPRGQWRPIGRRPGWAWPGIRPCRPRRRARAL